MPVPDFAQGVQNPFYWDRFLKHTHTQTADAKTGAAQTGAAKTADAGNSSSFWDDVLDVVNPLQHLPVVSTIYRAITGDKIGDVEQVAGDTLYGGPIGLVSSLANLAFEKITGKDFGDTVLAMVGLDNNDGTTALAADTPKPNSSELADKSAAGTSTAPMQLASAIKPMIVPVTSPVAAALLPIAKPPASGSVVDISPQTDALLQALARNGVTGQMRAQALDAYKRSMNLNTASIAPVLH